MCISRRFIVSRPYPAFPSLQHASGISLLVIDGTIGILSLQWLQPGATSPQLSCPASLAQPHALAVHCSLSERSKLPQHNISLALAKDPVPGSSQ